MIAIGCVLGTAVLVRLVLDVTRQVAWPLQLLAITALYLAMWAAVRALAAMVGPP